MATKVSLVSLLSTCADACARGCQVIRYVNAKRHKLTTCPNEASKCSSNSNDANNNNNNNNNNTGMEVRYKEVGDPRSALTEADIASQFVIIECLRNVWGEELKIIGEEDDDDENANNNEDDVMKKDMGVFDKYQVHSPTDKSVRKDIFDCCTHKEKIPMDDVVSLCDVTLYIDPMDGTREFVEHRLHNVQCLIGICYKGMPVGGVVGLPFLSEDNTMSISSTSTKGTNVVCGLQILDTNIFQMIFIPDNDTSRVQYNQEVDWVTPETSPVKPVISSTSNVTTTISTENNDTASTTQNSSTTGTNNDSTTKPIVINVLISDTQRPIKTKTLKCLNEWIQDGVLHDNQHSTNNKPLPKVELHIQQVGGCGSKFLHTLLSKHAISITTPGTCSWDTCAPSALLHASIAKFNNQDKCTKDMKRIGKVTDVFGGELIYDFHKGDKVKNDLGVFASSGYIANSDDVVGRIHDLLCQAMRNDRVILDKLLGKYWNALDEEDVSKNKCDELRIDTSEDCLLYQDKLQEARCQPQAIHATRNEEGYAMTVTELQSKIVSNPACTLSKEAKELIDTGTYQLVGYAIPFNDKMVKEDGDVKDTIQLCWKQRLGSKRRRIEEDQDNKSTKDSLDLSRENEPPSTVLYHRIASRGKVEILLP